MVLTKKLTDSVTPTPWRLKKRVLPQHTDHAGVMWHGAYVAWLEEARVEALVAAGLTYAEMTTLGVEMPVVSLNINYRHALCHGDMVVLESISSLPVGVRWPWHCQMLCNGQLMADASVELVMVTAGRVLRRPPAHLQALMNRLRQGPTAEDV